MPSPSRRGLARPGPGRIQDHRHRLAAVRPQRAERPDRDQRRARADGEALPIIPGLRRRPGERTGLCARLFGGGTPSRASGRGGRCVAGGGRGRFAQEAGRMRGSRAPPLASCVPRVRRPDDAAATGALRWQARPGSRPDLLQHGPQGEPALADPVADSGLAGADRQAALLSYGIPHHSPWGWRVSLYTWTKGVAVGGLLVPRDLADPDTPVALSRLVHTHGGIVVTAAMPARRPDWRASRARVLTQVGTLGPGRNTPARI